MSYNTEMDRQYKRGLAEGWRKGIAEGNGYLLDLSGNGLDCA